MRAGLSTIQQTLTPEAATVLNHSIAEAARRNHGQTTPLHVAATLLSSPSGYLRQACIKSHPNSSHPLQCRALELCFSVALERLPTSQNLSPGLEPPISNALMAALKRAQAHQRRGCPEQQQQPLLAVKVELEQLIISILDDPSVSRVMREASFSSPAVKATIEQSLNSSSINPANSRSIGLGFRSSVPVPTNRNLYVNPRLQQGGVVQSGQGRNEEVRRVVDIMLRMKKKNPVLVGETEPEMVVKELFRRIESKEIDNSVLNNVQVVKLEDFVEKDQIPARIVEIGRVIETRLRGLDCGGVILDLGDLKWLVEQTGGYARQVVSESARVAVAEMRKLLERFEGLVGGIGRVWLIGTATCETYLRCQVYHPSMESDWDLQAVSIAARATYPGVFPRMGTNGVLSSSVESLSPLKAFPSLTSTPLRRFSENFDPGQRMKCCPQCTQNYQQELAKIVVPKELDRSSSEVKSEAAQPPLPLWLRNAKSQSGDTKTSDLTMNEEQDLFLKQKSQDLRKKWHNMCLHLHPSHHQIKDGPERATQSSLSLTSLHNSTVIPRQTFQPKAGLTGYLGGSIPLNPKLLASQPPVPAQTRTPPGSPLRTDLVLGRPKVMEPTFERVDENPTKNLFELVSPEHQTNRLEIQTAKILSKLDDDSFKKLLKGLSEKVAWQHEAASAVASTVTQCKTGNGRRRGAASKGDIWLLFTGPDRVGKKKMALALSDQVYGSSPIVLSLGSQRDVWDSDQNLRGKTVLDRVVESVRRNPSSVVILEDIDEADLLVRGSIKRAMERGRLADSHGREVSLGNTIFILTADWLPDNLKFLPKGISLDEKKLASLANGDWQLRLSVCEKTAKRRAEWLADEDRPIKPKKDSGSGLAFDLNEAADTGDEKADGSHNSSDLTVDHEDEHVHGTGLLAPTTSPIPSELVSAVDDHIIFKPVDFAPIRRDISDSLSRKCSSIIGDKTQIEFHEEALEKIVGGVWLGQTSLEEWSDKVLVPILHRVKMQLSSSWNESSIVIKVENTNNFGSQRSRTSLLPTSIELVVNGL